VRGAYPDLVERIKIPTPCRGERGKVQDSGKREGGHGSTRSKDGKRNNLIKWISDEAPGWGSKLKEGRREKMIKLTRGSTRSKEEHLQELKTETVT